MTDLTVGDMIREVNGPLQEYRVACIYADGTLLAVTPMGRERVFEVDEVERVAESGYRKPGT